MSDNPIAAPAATDPAYELPACFYLGREYDLERQEVRPGKYVMYDARDLTTHGVVVGMTGSGKTGLCITLLEEAAIDGIPAILLDLKGDLTNLLLQFPDLAPEQFQKWLNPSDAEQKGLKPEQYARQLADIWRKGLAESEQGPERISRLKAAADYRIYTPGSDAGLALSILDKFSAPRYELPLESLTEKVDATVTALLGLAGIPTDSLHSREHILLAQLLLDSWQKRTDLDLPGLIQQIQHPPIKQIGAYSLETFFPAAERVKFASLLNNVLASPSLAAWRIGMPLDLSTMMYQAGRPQHLIFYIAHLDDRQRMFFVTLLLGELLSWMRRQTGTTQLRALLYFDEVFGYLPPHPLNPPSKQPLLTLLKQGRAFGLGVLLATQNPVDLDYKALSNAGTWFIGKLQTERDKARLLDGLESVAAENGTLTDRSSLERVIASLRNRLFMMHNIHHPQPRLFQTRWALSFLRGPLDRKQVGVLMKPVKDKMEEERRQQALAAVPQAIPLCTWCHTELTADVADSCPSCGKVPWANALFRTQDKAFREHLQRQSVPTAEIVTDTKPAERVHPPVLPPDVNQFFLPVKTARPSGAVDLGYRPMVLGFGEVNFVIDKRKGKEKILAIRLLAEPAPMGYPLAWERAEAVGEHFEPAQPAQVWDRIPDSLDTGRKLKSLEKGFAEFLYGNQKLALFENRQLELISEPGETLEQFRQRCQQAAEEQARQAIEMERVKFKPRFEALDSSLPDNPPPARATGASWLGWLNPLGGTTPSKASAASSDEDPKLRKLTADYLAKKNEIIEKWRRVGEEATQIQIKPRKADVRITHFGIGWVPYYRAKGS